MLYFLYKFYDGGRRYSVEIECLKALVGTWRRERVRVRSLAFLLVVSIRL